MLTNALFVDSIHLIIKLRKKMQNRTMKIEDNVLLRKRTLIETIRDEPKNICQIQHTQHRSFINFFNNLMAGLAAYCFLPKKPAISYQSVMDSQLTLF